MRKEVILILHIGYAVGHITVAPRNAAVVTGDAMSMECRTDEDFRVRRWELSRAIGEAINVYSHGDQSPYNKEFTHFGVQVNANGSGFIYTHSTRMTDSGLYTCVTREGSYGKTVRVTAQLTVFESQPVCKANLTADGNKSLTVGDSIWLRCSVAFRGFWTPTMQWIRHSGNGDIGNVVTRGVEMVRLPNTSVTSTLDIKVDSSMKGVLFSCRTYFTQYDGIQLSLDDIANNIPNFNYTWNSEAVALQNGLVPGTDTISVETASSYNLDYLGILLIAGLSIFLTLVIIAVTICLVYKRKRASGRLLELLDTGYRQSIQPDRSTHEPRLSTDLNSETEAEVDTVRLEMAPSNDGYCSLTGVSQEPKVYSQLRLQVPQNTDYINLPQTNYANLPSNEQRQPNQYPVYCNVVQ